MTAAHAFELPPDDGVPSEVVEQARSGEIVYLTTNGVSVVAIVPLNVAAVGAAALQAVEDAADLQEIEDGLAERGFVPQEYVLAEYADVLKEYPADDPQ